MIVPDPQVQELIMRALEAEGQAARQTNQADQADWHRIAEGYYELAEAAIRTASIIAALEEPLPANAFPTAVPT
jgi:hypothetical protein